MIDAKSDDLSGFLSDLLKKNAILVVNKSDLLNGELNSEINDEIQMLYKKFPLTF